MTQHTLVSPKVEVLHGFGRWSVTRHRLCTVALVLSAVRWRGSTEVLGLSHWVFFIKTGIIAKATVFLLASLIIPACVASDLSPFAYTI